MKFQFFKRKKERKKKFEPSYHKMILFVHPGGVNPHWDAIYEGG